MVIVLYITTYFMLINFVTFIAYYIDKRKALNKERRISEFALLLLVLIGGTVGGLVAMFVVRHKTKKISFLIKLGMVITLQVSLVVAYFNPTIFN